MSEDKKDEKPEGPKVGPIKPNENPVEGVEDLLKSRIAKAYNEDFEKVNIPPMEGADPDKEPGGDPEPDPSQGSGPSAGSPPGADQQKPDLALKFIVKVIEKGTIKAFEKSVLTEEETAFSDEEHENWILALKNASPAFLTAILNSPYAALVTCILSTYGLRFMLMEEKEKAMKKAKNQTDGQKKAG